MAFGIKIKAPKVRIKIKKPADVVKSLSKGVKEFTQKSQDVATLGQRDQVNALTGGGLDAIKDASGGDSKSALRVGVTAGAFAAGGPMAAIAANSAFANGGNVGQAGLAAVTNSQGGEMSIFNDVGNFLNSDTAIAKLANSSLSGLINGKPKPAPVVVRESAPVQTIVSGGAGMSKGLMYGLGAAAVAVVLILVVALKKR